MDLLFELKANILINTEAAELGIVVERVSVIILFPMQDSITYLLYRNSQSRYRQRQNQSSVRQAQISKMRNLRLYPVSST